MDNAAQVLAFATALVGFVLGFFGWWIELEATPIDIPGVFLSSLRLYIARPDLVTNESLNPLLRTAAFLSGISGFFGVVAVWLAAANRTLAELFLQFFRSDHVVVVGNGSFAGSVGVNLTQAGQAVARILLPDGEGDHRVAPGLVLPSDHTIPRKLAARAGLGRARMVVIDAGDDFRTASVAASLVRLMDAGHRPGPADIVLRMDDDMAADHAIELLKRQGSRHRFRAFNQNRQIARYALARTPLFPLAAARGQRRVHAVIAGFNDLGEKLMDQIMLTSVAGDLAIPRITFVGAEAERWAAELEARRPRLQLNLPVSFAAVDLGAEPLQGPGISPGAARLGKILADDPATAIYILHDSFSENLRIARLLDQHHRLEGRTAAPIFLAPGSGIAKDLLSDGAERLQDLVRASAVLDLPARIVVAEITGQAKSDLIARQLHERYFRTEASSPAAAQSWDELGETWRRANVRAADHLPAKLWTLGLAGNPSAIDEGVRAQLRSIVSAGPGSDPLRNLARVEHDRWMVERFLASWTYGPERDEMRRLHPCLVSFEEIADDAVELEKDLEQIRGALAHVIDGGDLNFWGP